MVVRTGPHYRMRFGNCMFSVSESGVFRVVSVSPTPILSVSLVKIGCPTWIRTMTKASKGPCATVTPSDKTHLKLTLPDPTAIPNIGVAEWVSNGGPGERWGCLAEAAVPAKNLPADGSAS